MNLAVLVRPLVACGVARLPSLPAGLLDKATVVPSAISGGHACLRVRLCVCVCVRACVCVLL